MFTWPMLLAAIKGHRERPRCVVIADSATATIRVGYVGIMSPTDVEYAHASISVCLPMTFGLSVEVIRHPMGADALADLAERVAAWHDAEASAVLEDALEEAGWGAPEHEHGRRVIM